MPRRPWGRDAWLVALAIVIGIPSLTFPFGRDQGLFHYIGREWLTRGAIPYRDAIEHKPPGIFIVHGLLFRVFGEQMWAVRLLDIVLVVTCSVAGASLLRKRPWRTRGLVGTTCLSTSIVYYGFFTFWDQAQCEIVCGTLAMIAAALVWRAKRARTGELGAGLLAGAAFIVKPPILPLIAVVGVLVLLRAWRGSVDGRRRRLAVGAARYTGAALVIPLATLGYFALHGALGELKLWLVDVNRYYVVHERSIFGVSGVLVASRTALLDFAPFSPAVMTATLFAIVGRLRRRSRDATEHARRRTRFVLASFAVVCGAAFAAYAGVCAQMKFFHYHLVLFIGPWSVLSGLLFLELFGRERRRGRFAPAVIPAVTLVSFLLSRSFTDAWLDPNISALRLIAGIGTREEFTRAFDLPHLWYEYHDTELVGRWLREHSSPNDSIAVRGFEPQIYAVAGRRYAHRFFWTNFITEKRRSMLHDEWLAEEREVLETDPPRFAVTIMDSAPIVGTDWYAPHGYTERVRFGSFRILEKN